MLRRKRLDGHINKKQVRKWLENYQNLDAGDRPDDYVPTNSGPKPEDGVTGGMINKIMLDKAIGQLPPELYFVVKCRWVDKLPLGETFNYLKLQGIEIAKTTYYKRCDKAVDFIYRKVNGLYLNYAEFLDKVEKEIKKG